MGRVVTYILLDFASRCVETLISSPHLFYSFLAGPPTFGSIDQRDEQRETYKERSLFSKKLSQMVSSLSE